MATTNGGHAILLAIMRHFRLQTAGYLTLTARHFPGAQTLPASAGKFGWPRNITY
jgi:hypothetical protein